MSDYLTYILIFTVFTGLELIYFRIADYFNIIDHPNERSSHTAVTLRGGGVIFPISILAYAIISGFEYPYFYTGLLIISIVSFLDDISSIPPKFRLIIHVTAVTLLFIDSQFIGIHIVFVFIGYIVIIGIINAYNFMDGINGITGLYSLIFLCTLYWINYLELFVESKFLIFAIISVLIFLYFNFRMRARCFSGDVGSITIAYILIFSLSLLTVKTGEYIYILLLAVYGVDTVLTILGRLTRKENIFEAHRLHLYQILANEGKINQLLISATYAAVQLLINVLLIWLIYSGAGIEYQVLFAVVTLSILSLSYILVKRRYKLAIL